MRDPHEYIDHDIRWLLEDAAELAEYVLPNFEELGEGEQDIWLYGFPNEMAKARRLERIYRAGEMSAEQEERYRLLKVKLKEISPALWEQLDLTVPAEILEG